MQLLKKLKDAVVSLLKPDSPCKYHFLAGLLAGILLHALLF